MITHLGVQGNVYKVYGVTIVTHQKLETSFKLIDLEFGLI